MKIIIMLKIEIVWPPKTLEKIIKGKNKFISLNSASNIRQISKKHEIFLC